MLRAARLILLAFTAMLAIGAVTATAAPRMPIGFFDDPTFRWSADRADNLHRAAADGASIIHTTANWPTLAPTRPASATNGDDPAYKLADLDELVQQAQRVRDARDDRHQRHTEVGERQHYAEPHAEEASPTSRPFARMLGDAIQRPATARATSACGRSGTSRTCSSS